MLAQRRPLAAAAVVAMIGLFVAVVFASASAYSNARIADMRQQVIIDHGTRMKEIGDQVNLMFEAGHFEGTFVPLILLGQHLKDGGELDEGVIKFSERFEALFWEHEKQGTQEKDQC